MNTIKEKSNVTHSNTKSKNPNSIDDIEKDLQELYKLTTFSLKHLYEIICQQLSQIPKDDVVIFISPTADLTEEHCQVKSKWSSFPSKIKNMIGVNENELLFNIICFANKIINEIQKETSNSFCFIINDEFDELFTKDFLQLLGKRNYESIKEPQDLLNYLNGNYDNISKRLCNITKKSVHEIVSLCYDLIEEEKIKKTPNIESSIHNKEIIHPDFLRIILFKDNSSFDKYSNKELSKILTCFTKGRYINYMGVTINLFPFPDDSKHYKKVKKDNDQIIFNQISDTADTFRKNQFSQIEELITILSNNNIDIKIQYDKIIKEMTSFNIEKNKSFVQLLEDFDNKISEIKDLKSYITDQLTNMRTMHQELKNNIKEEMEKELKEHLDVFKVGFNSIIQTIKTNKTTTKLKQTAETFDTYRKKFINEIPTKLKSANIWKAKINYMETLQQIINDFNNKIINLPNF